jgi:hypothetical protein
MTHEDLAIGSGSYIYYGPHYHLQLSATALLDPTLLTIDVRGLTSFTVHGEASYLPSTCEQTSTDGDFVRLTCQVAPGQGAFAIDVVVAGQLDVTMRVDAVDNDDPDPTNNVLTFLS